MFIPYTWMFFIIISGNVFYLMEYRDVFVMLLKKFDETRQSRYM